MPVARAQDPMSFERFLFVPMGSAAPAAAISCDGLVPGSDLDLSHWVGNRTPAELKADTSTEIALNFARSPMAARFEGHRVANNHFDTDGVLACFAVMKPDAAAERAPLMIAAAEAGDFSEWPADRRGLWVDAAFSRLADDLDADDDAACYAAVLPQVIPILDGIEDRKELWRDSWERIQAAMRLVNEGRVSAGTRGGIGIVRHGEGVPEIPGPVIAKLLQAQSWRYLLCFEHAGGRFSYRYELPRYAWAETVVRTPLDPPELEPILRALGPGFRAAPHSPGGTAFLESAEPLSVTPDEMVRGLFRSDPVASVER